MSACGGPARGRVWHRSQRRAALVTQARAPSTGPRFTPSKRVPLDVLDRVCQRGALANAALQLLPARPGGTGAPAPSLRNPLPLEHTVLRFPASEFRALCINPLAKSSFLGPFPDKGTWNRHKTELAQLLLLLSAGQAEAYDSSLGELVKSSLIRELHHVRKALDGEQYTDEDRERLQRRYQTRKAKLSQQFDTWCRATVKHPNFQLMKPVLQKVLEVEPEPPVDNKRDGQLTEHSISSMVARELPEGWTMYTQCRLTGLDNGPFRNEKMVKGEADVLLTDAYGIVQAILEVKTAKGNPYLALWEDVQRFRNMTEKVRGRLVSFVPCQGHPLPAAQASAPQGNSAAAGTGLPKTGDPNAVVTLRFSKNVRPIYVLGTCISPEELRTVVRSAQAKLLTMEFGRILSTQIDAWRGLTVLEVNKDSAVLQVPLHSVPQCEQNVYNYFRELQRCDIFMVPASAQDPAE